MPHLPYDVARTAVGALRHPLHTVTCGLLLLSHVGACGHCRPGKVDWSTSLQHSPPGMKGFACNVPRALCVAGHGGTAGTGLDCGGACSSSSRRARGRRARGVAPGRVCLSRPARAAERRCLMRGSTRRRGALRCGPSGAAHVPAAPPPPPPRDASPPQTSRPASEAREAAPALPPRSAA